MNCGSTAHPQNRQLIFFFFCFLREHHLSDHRRRAAEGAAASQESEEEGENTSRSVCDGSDEASSAQSHRRLSVSQFVPHRFPDLPKLLDVSREDASCYKLTS